MLFGLLFWVSIITIYTKESSKNICIEEKLIFQLTFNPGLALTGFQTILPCFQQVNQPWAHNPIEKPAIGQRSTSKKHLTSMSCKLEPTIWSHDTGQQIPSFDKCQLIITWMSNIKEGHRTTASCLCQPIIWSMAAILLLPSCEQYC